MIPTNYTTTTTKQFSYFRLTTAILDSSIKRQFKQKQYRANKFKIYFK